MPNCPFLQPSVRRQLVRRSVSLSVRQASLGSWLLVLLAAICIEHLPHNLSTLEQNFNYSPARGAEHFSSSNVPGGKLTLSLGEFSTMRNSAYGGNSRKARVLCLRNSMRVFRISFGHTQQTYCNGFGHGVGVVPG